LAFLLEPSHDSEGLHSKVAPAHWYNQHQTSSLQTSLRC
jgi:hypothetical protein